MALLRIWPMAEIDLYAMIETTQSLQAFAIKPQRMLKTVRQLLTKAQCGNSANDGGQHRYLSSTDAMRNGYRFGVRLLGAFSRICSRRARASRLPRCRIDAKADNCALRGRELPCSHL